MSDVYPVEEALVRFLRVAPPAGAKERTRDRMILAAQHRRPPRPRAIRRTVVLLAATLALSGGAFAAGLPVAAGSLPGDALYRVKLAGERVRLAFARGAEADVRLHLEFAQTRIDEMGRALEAGRAAELEELDDRYSAHIVSALALAQGDDELLTLLLGAMERHGSTLTSLLADAPVEAADALRHSIEVSSKAGDGVADALERAETGGATSGGSGDPGGQSGSGGSDTAPTSPTTPTPSGDTTGGEAEPGGSTPPTPGSTPTPTSVPSSQPSSPPSSPASAPSGQPTSTPPP